MRPTGKGSGAAERAALCRAALHCRLQNVEVRVGSYPIRPFIPGPLPAYVVNVYDANPLCWRLNGTSATVPGFGLYPAVYDFSCNDNTPMTGSWVVVQNKPGRPILCTGLSCALQVRSADQCRGSVQQRQQQCTCRRRAPLAGRAIWRYRR